MRKTIIFLLLLVLIPFVYAEGDNVHIFNGKIFDDTNDIVLNPLLKFQYPINETQEDLNGNYSINFYQDIILLREYRFNVTPDITDFFTLTNYSAFYFFVDMPINTNSIKIKEGAVIIDEFSISVNVPQINSLNIQQVGDDYNITWTAEDIDGDTLYYDLFYSNDGIEWSPIVINTVNNDYLLENEGLPGGSANIIITASDGFNEVELVSESFDVELKNPVIFIDLPLDDSIFFANDEFSLAGYAYDLEDGELNVSWYVDNDLITDESSYIHMITEPGDYVLKAIAEDSDGLTIQNNINIKVLENVFGENGIKPGWNLISPFILYDEKYLDAVIDLKKGWNLFGFNSDQPVKWSDCSIRNSQIVKLVDGATQEGWIQGIIYYYYNDQFRFTPDEEEYLVPGKSYWLYSYLDDSELYIPYATSQGYIGLNEYWLNYSVSNGSGIMTISEAQDSGWLQSTLYYFDEQNQDYDLVPGDDSNIYPWRGYWLWSNRNLSLVIS
jgi:hypothetical protein